MGHQGLGDLEQLVLIAVARLSGNAYAVSVRDEINKRTGRSISRGAIYVTLGRLEQKGYLSSMLGDPTPERGGKAKRMFAITRSGEEVMETSLRALRAMIEDVPRLGWTL